MFHTFSTFSIEFSSNLLNIHPGFKYSTSKRYIWNGTLHNCSEAQNVWLENALDRKMPGSNRSDWNFNRISRCLDGIWMKFAMRHESKPNLMAREAAIVPHSSVSEAQSDFVKFENGLSFKSDEKKQCNRGRLRHKNDTPTRTAASQILSTSKAKCLSLNVAAINFIIFNWGSHWKKSLFRLVWFRVYRESRIGYHE